MNAPRSTGDGPGPPGTPGHGTSAGPPTDVEALLAFDRAHVWHPYSSALTPQDPYLVESAHGIRLRLRDRGGEPREVVDAMASWWCAIHGYAVPELDAAARAPARLDVATSCSAG